MIAPVRGQSAVETRNTPKGANADCPERARLESRINGAFQVVREIGRGGMGVVFLARDVRLHRLVAIKVLRHEFCGSEEHRARFRREARLTARLGGDGIVAVHGFEEDAELAYMVMAFVNGHSLADALATPNAPGRMAPERVRAILSDLAMTLHRAHTAGVVHRDLKPENILLDRDSGRALLTDFGVAIARTLDSLPGGPERAYGTPHFMSPEQAAGELDLDGRSDIYSLGVIGYLLLSGELPFEAEDTATLAARHIAEPPMPVREKARGVPKDLADAIDRCLAKDPALRWRSGQAVAEALSMNNRYSFIKTVIPSALSAAVAALVVAIQDLVSF